MRTKPEIRSKGFPDDWEQRKLGDIGSVAMYRRVFKHQTAESGDIPFSRSEHSVAPRTHLSQRSFTKISNQNILIPKKAIF